MIGWNFVKSNSFWRATVDWYFGIVPLGETFAKWHLKKRIQIESEKSPNSD